MEQCGHVNPPASSSRANSLMTLASAACQGGHWIQRISPAVVRRGIRSTTASSRFPIVAIKACTKLASSRGGTRSDSYRDVGPLIDLQSETWILFSIPSTSGQNLPTSRFRVFQQNRPIAAADGPSAGKRPFNAKFPRRRFKVSVQHAKLRPA